jgi:predicted NACHT family NTPase
MLDTSVDIFLKLVRSAYQGMAGYAREQDFFKTATRKYIQNLRDDYGQIRMIGSSDHVPLESLYVRANILEKVRARGGVFPDEMDAQRDLYLSAFGGKTETLDGEEVVNRERKFIVLGKPGAGKTTYLKYLALRMVTDDPKSVIRQRKLPVFIELHKFAKKNLPLLDYIAEEFKLCGFPEARGFVERMLGNGDCIVLLDGLDEVPRETRLDDVIQQVSDFTREYRECQFVVSCRVAAYNHWFTQYREVEMADFNEAQIRQYVANFFKKEPATGTACWEKLNSAPALKEMASSPLLLTLLCITYDARQDFPANRALLYGKAMDALLNQWDAARRIQRDKLYKDLDEAKLILLLSRLAAGYFENNTYFFGEEDLQRGIGTFLSELIGPKAKTKGAAVLQDIEEHYGILVRRSQFAFSFAHLTFLEYFTAQYVVDKQMSGSINLLINSHFREDRWLEVFLLVAGKIGDSAGEFVHLLQRKNRELLEEVPELNELLRVVQGAILPKKSKYSRLEREWGGLYLARARALALDRALDLDLARALDLARDLDLDLARALDRALDLDLDQLEAYGKANNLTPQIAEKITDYLTGNLWLAKCLRSGAHISQEVRERVLGEMFKPK